MRIIFIFAIFGIFIFGIFLGFLSPVASALTQAEFTKLLQEVHPFFQQQKLNLEIQKKNQKSYLGATGDRKPKKMPKIKMPKIAKIKIILIVFKFL